MLTCSNHLSMSVVLLSNARFLFDEVSAGYLSIILSKIPSIVENMTKEDLVLSLSLNFSFAVQHPHLLESAKNLELKSENIIVRECTKILIKILDLKKITKTDLTELSLILGKEEICFPDGSFRYSLEKMYRILLSLALIQEYVDDFKDILGISLLKFLSHIGNSLYQVNFDVLSASSMFRCRFLELWNRAFHKTTKLSIDVTNTYDDKWFVFVPLTFSKRYFDEFHVYNYPDEGTCGNLTFRPHSNSLRFRNITLISNMLIFYNWEAYLKKLEYKITFSIYSQNIIVIFGVHKEEFFYIFTDGKSFCKIESSSIEIVKYITIPERFSIIGTSLLDFEKRNNKIYAVFHQSNCVIISEGKIPKVKIVRVSENILQIGNRFIQVFSENYTKEINGLKFILQKQKKLTTANEPAKIY